MKKISLILAIVMIFALMTSLVSCNEELKSIDPKDAVIADMVAEIEKVAPYGEYTSEMLYMADDPDEMVKWTYGVVDLAANDFLYSSILSHLSQCLMSIENSCLAFCSDCHSLRSNLESVGFIITKTLCDIFNLNIRLIYKLIDTLCHHNI